MNEQSLGAGHLSTQDMRLFRFTREQIVSERTDDLHELKWLWGESLYKLTALENTEEPELVPLPFYREVLSHIRNRIDGYLENPASCAAVDFLRIKYELRMMLKQLGGVLSSSDWQSPSLTQSPVKEQGSRQTEVNVYLRTGGSDHLQRYEDRFFREYYPMSPESRARSAANLTVSGMKALEAALLISRILTSNRLPLYHQVGYYFEGITLLRDMYPDARSVSVEQIYEMVDNQEEMGCLLLEPGLTWPVREGIDLEILFSKLENHRQELPLFVIIDRTLTSIANPLFQRFADRLPEHVILVCVESGIKYFQFGMELTNLGFLAFCGSRVSDEPFAKLLEHVMNVLSGVPEPSLVWRLPEPSMPILQKRMHRLARNMNVLFEFFEELRSEGHVRSLFPSVPEFQPCQVLGEPWIGSLMYFQLPEVATFQEYERIAAEWVQQAPPSLHFHMGGSFGFDTMRVNAVEESPERENNSALRLSVGRDTMEELARKGAFFRKLLQGGV